MAATEVSLDLSLLCHQEIGSIIRKYRKMLNYRLEDLADEFLSISTVSNIERGVGNYKEDKILHLLHKLNIPIEDLPQLIKQEQGKFNEIHEHLDYVEALLHAQVYEEAFETLRDLKLEEDHSCAPRYLFVEGKYYVKEHKWKLAKSSLLKALNLAPAQSENNLLAAIYLELSRTSFYINEMREGLEFTEKGIDVFNPHGDNKYYLYTLHFNRFVFFNGLDRYAEGLKAVTKVWGLLQSNDVKMRARLGFYYFRAMFNYRLQLYDDALDYANQGLAIAQANSDPSNEANFFTMIGSIYLAKNIHEQAERYLLLATKFDHQARGGEIILTYLRLGKLYLEQKRWSEADEMLNEAYAAAKKDNRSTELFYSLLYLGDLAKGKEEITEACTSYEKAKKIAIKYSYENKEMLAWSRLAVCSEENNEQEFNLCKDNIYRLFRDKRS